MKKMSVILLTSLLLSPAVSFSQSSPQPPADWVSFQKEESAKRAAFNAQMRADIQAFMASHPEMKAYFAQMGAASKARMAAWRAQHQNRI